MKELKTLLKCLRGLPHADAQRIDDFSFTLEEITLYVKIGSLHKVLQLEQRLWHISTMLLADSLDKSINDTWG